MKIKSEEPNIPIEEDKEKSIFDEWFEKEPKVNPYIRKKDDDWTKYPISRLRKWSDGSGCAAERCAEEHRKKYGLSPGTPVPIMIVCNCPKCTANRPRLSC